MILEAASLQVKPGQSAPFEAAFREAQAIISSMPGYRSHELQRCIEREGHYLLLVRWDSVVAHEEGFRKSPQYQQWKQLLHHFYDPFPTVLHHEAVAGVPVGTKPQAASVAPVQRQLDAYNARDLDRFLAEFSDDIRVFRPPAAEPAIAGKKAFAGFYATQRFGLAGLHAELVSRMVLGNKVIDHERISGVRERPFEIAVVYEVSDGLIRCMWTHEAG